MAEQLGGSRGRNEYSSNTLKNPLLGGGSRLAQRGGGGGGYASPGSPGFNGTGYNFSGSNRGVRPMTARPAGNGGYSNVSPTGGGGGGGYSLGVGGTPPRIQRPASAPRERPGMGLGSGRGSAGISGAGSPNGGYTSARKSGTPQARVEALRQMKEAQFWGRVAPAKRDLPPFWSVETHGQPFNDARLATGTNSLFKVLEPSGLDPGEAEVTGPATMQQAMLRKSLETGSKMFKMADLSPLPAGVNGGQRLSDAEREFLLTRLTPHLRIHALRNSLDRDGAAKDFLPWPRVVVPQYSEEDYRTMKETCIRVALLKVENWMRRHLKYMSDKECEAAHAPAALEKDILKRAFWKVDPSRTGTVSIQQFLQVWQNVLCLMEYDDGRVKGIDGKSRHILIPRGRRLINQNMAAGLFVKHGFDKDGLLPYIVFMQAICCTPARLLGHELVLDKKTPTAAHKGGVNGLLDEYDIAYAVGDAKIEYRFCNTGVFPPGGFDARVAYRSFMAPKAHMWLEHVYGYAGINNTANNLFYTHNCSEDVTEMVYYSGAVGIVFDKEKWKAGQPCQKFFFGHDNDIQCLTIHPNRRWVATGQQKKTGKKGVPYACVWDVDTCELLQKLDHAVDERGVLAVCFSGNINAPADKQGGELLITVTADDKHTIHVWRWMTAADAYCKSQYIPGWYYGPEKKLNDLRSAGIFWNQHAHPNDKLVQAAVDKGIAADVASGNLAHDRVESETRLRLQEALQEARGSHNAQAAQLAISSNHPCIEQIRECKVHPDAAEGFYPNMELAKADGTSQLLDMLPGCTGTPPMIYGVIWNPLRPSDGRKGSEFAVYGVKHLKVWIVNDTKQWQGANASFGTAHIENVLSAAYVPALHAMAAPGDSCLLTGFTSGEVGLWVPPYPTRAGAVYQLTRKFEAHMSGLKITLNDGTQVYGGVRVIVLREDNRTVLTGGADGCVLSWRLDAPTTVRVDGTEVKGVKLTCLGDPSEETGPDRFKLVGPSVPGGMRVDLPMVVGLDAIGCKPAEFAAGTSGCDIWEVDQDPIVMVEGHEAALEAVAPHPTDPCRFATACESGVVRVWDTNKRDVILSAALGFPAIGIAYSQEECKPGCVPGWRGPGFHIAVGSKNGRVAILDAQTLQPLVHMADVPSRESNDELKYSPPGGPGILAVGSHDLKIYLYRVNKGYQLISRCIGHSGTILHLDFSWPIAAPGTALDGRFILQSSDASKDLLYWDPLTGKKLSTNQRDARWATWTNTLGFNVMGIWPDASVGNDVNSVCRAAIGATTWDPAEAAQEGNAATAVEDASEDASADGVPGCSYLITADDFSTVKLFNYPVVTDDAPYKAFRGHASFVAAARFQCDDRLAITAGGYDRGIYQWRTCGIALADQQKDAQILSAMSQAIANKRHGTLTHVPAAGLKPDEWGPLDKDGRVYGPIGSGAVGDAKTVDLNMTGRSLGGSMNLGASLRSGTIGFGTPNSLGLNDTGRISASGVLGGTGRSMLGVPKFIA